MQGQTCQMLSFTGCVCVHKKCYSECHELLTAKPFEGLKNVSVHIALK